MIKLQNNYQIDSDGTQFILKRSRIAKKEDTGEEYEAFEVAGYYGGLQMALKGYCRKVLLDKTKCEAVSLYQVLDMLKELKKEIEAYD